MQLHLNINLCWKDALNLLSYVKFSCFSCTAKYQTMGSSLCQKPLLGQAGTLHSSHSTAGSVVKHQGRLLLPSGLRQ